MASTKINVCVYIGGGVFVCVGGGVVLVVCARCTILNLCAILDMCLYVSCLMHECVCWWVSVAMIDVCVESTPTGRGGEWV